MSRLILYVFLALATVAAANAAGLSKLDIEIAINDDKTTEWAVSVQYNENVTKSDFYLLARRITALEVTANNTFLDCDITKRGVGTGIICQGVAADSVVYKFRGHEMVSDFEDLQLFNHRFPVTELVGNISVTVKLPLGTAIVEQSKISGTGLQRFEPLWGREGSDGRRIYVIWKQENPKLGEPINISIVYEQIFGNQAAVLMIPLLAATFILFIYLFRKRFSRDILPILTDNERKVVEMLMHAKKSVDQRSIVRETDYSKSKVSRILSNLESRGLIERSRKGRTNMVKFKRL